MVEKKDWQRTWRMVNTEELTKIMFYKMFIDTLPNRFKKMKWKERKKYFEKKKAKFIKDMENG